jgi:hypothetical protein
MELRHKIKQEFSIKLDRKILREGILFSLR